MPYTLITDLNDASQPGLLQDRGLHYGDGLFETMLLDAGQIRYWDQHYQRLASSALRLKINCPEKTWFERHLLPFLIMDQTLVIKIILTRGSGGRGLSLPEKLYPNIYILHYLYISYVIV